jgi:hypothetical protein
MSELLVCEGATLKFKTNPLITAGTISINETSVKSNKVKTSGNKVYTRIDFTITGLTLSSGFTQTTPAIGSISNTLVTTKVDTEAGIPIIKTNGSGSVTVPGLAPPKNTPAYALVTVQIDNPGQSKVKAK